MPLLILLIHLSASECLGCSHLGFIPHSSQCLRTKQERRASLIAAGCRHSAMCSYPGTQSQPSRPGSLFSWPLLSPRRGVSVLKSSGSHFPAGLSPLMCCFLSPVYCQQTSPRVTANASQPSGWCSSRVLYECVSSLWTQCYGKYVFSTWPRT